MSKKDKATFTRIAEMASSISNMASGSAKDSGSSDDGSLFSSKDVPKNRKASNTTADQSYSERDRRGDDDRKGGVPKDVTIGGIAGLLFTPWIGVGNANESVKEVAQDPVGFWREELSKAPILLAVIAIVLLFGLSSACSKLGGSSVNESAPVQYEQVLDEQAEADQAAAEEESPLEKVHSGEASYSEATQDYLSSIFG